MLFMAAVTQALQNMKSQCGAGWRLTPVSKMRVAPPPIKDFLLLLGNEGEARGKWKSPGLGVLCISLESLPWASHLLSLGLTASLPGLCG